MVPLKTNCCLRLSVLYVHIKFIAVSSQPASDRLASSEHSVSLLYCLADNAVYSINRLNNIVNLFISYYDYC